MPLQFRVQGPYEIDCPRARGERAITRACIQRFWSDNPHLKDGVGCYVFGLRHGRGMMPGYVGRTVNCFSQEVFTPHKLMRYRECMDGSRKGSPVMFFVVAERRRGAINRNAILDCEEHLIWWALQRNPNLTNDQLTGGPSFSIPHLTEAARGRPDRSAEQLGMMLGLRSPKPKTRRQESVPASDLGAGIVDAIELAA